uniref:Small ribosomal subunit protein bS6m n=1 Tax=Plectus sambesii TaxID=2011161 RepID=A0A914VYR5_9BILA
MPFYELTLITRNLAKPDLYKTLHRAAKTLLEHGAVIRELQSLGHRDLPHKLSAKQTKESTYSSNYFLISLYMSRDEQTTMNSVLHKDLDILKSKFVKIEPEEQIECTLDEELKPVTQRQSVQDLRQNQKVGHFTRQKIYKRVEKEWRAIPKSFPIAPMRE